MIRRPLLASLVILLLAACAPTMLAPAGGAGFSHLRAGNGALITRHAIPLRVTADGAFRTTPVLDRIATFDDHPFEVSLAALLGRDEAVLVHAERVADSSGASNYDTLPRAGWPDDRFGVRRMCAAIDAATVSEEHDLGFLARNGWSPVGNLALEQYLASTADHNQEVVISLAVRVADCGDDAAVRQTLRRLRDKVRVTR